MQNSAKGLSHPLSSRLEPLGQVASNAHFTLAGHYHSASAGQYTTAGTCLFFDWPGPFHDPFSLSRSLLLELYLVCNSPVERLSRSKLKTCLFQSTYHSEHLPGYSVCALLNFVRKALSNYSLVAIQIKASM